jgi:hypothetical protein
MKKEAHELTKYINVSGMEKPQLRSGDLSGAVHFAPSTIYLS